MIFSYTQVSPKDYLKDLERIPLFSLAKPLPLPTTPQSIVSDPTASSSSSSSSSHSHSSSATELTNKNKDKSIAKSAKLHPESTPSTHSALAKQGRQGRDSDPSPGADQDVDMTDDQMEHHDHKDENDEKQADGIKIGNFVIQPDVSMVSRAYLHRNLKRQRQEAGSGGLQSIQERAFNVWASKVGQP